MNAPVIQAKIMSGTLKSATDSSPRFVAQDEQGRDREHDPRRSSIDGRCNRLVNIVFNNTGTSHQAAENSPTEDRGQLGTFNRETEFECRVTDRNGNHRTQKPTDQHGRPGKFRVGT